VRFERTSFCTRCNQDRPVSREYPTGRDGTRGRRKVWVCVVCHEEAAPIPSKMRNIPTASKLSLGRDGKPRMFQSRKEARREPALVALQNVGAITELQYQRPFELAVYGSQAVEALLEAVEAWGQHRVLAREVRLSRQHVARYIADFTYLDDRGVFHVEDVKGRRLPEYRMKKKLMAACWNIEIEEPEDTGVQQRARGAGVVGAHTGYRLRGRR
jgi:hypothetical protein